MEAFPAIPSRLQVLHEHKGRGGFVGGVFPIHYPRALLRAFDILPVEVWGPPAVRGSLGSAHLQPYVCSIVHNGLSFLLSGGLEVVDFIFVPHACDSLQGLGSLLVDFMPPTQPVLPIYIPRGRRECDVDFFAAEIGCLYDRLQALTSRSPSNPDLLECILREQAADQLLAELHKQRQDLPFTNQSFYRLLRSREFLPAESFSVFARQALAMPGQAPHEGVPILLSGILPEPMSVLEALSGMGAQIAGDDLACCGRRLYPPGEHSHPFQRMAHSILDAPPDSTRGSPIRERCQHLLRLVSKTGARGVVFYVVKFCEPELFDLPILRRELGDAGVPSLVIEVDLNDPLSQRVLTRLEAFMETLQ